jgi:hypothetical protein
MEERLVRSQCGLYTVLAGQKTLHSRYNPLTEAERYVDLLAWRGEIHYIILAECGLCYLIEPLRKKFPSAKIISLHISGFYNGKSVAPPDAEWQPESADSLGLFLEKEICDTEADKIKIIEWRPAADIYGGEYLNLIKDITAFVKRADANKRTKTAFGRRWIRNVIKNCFLFTGDTSVARVTRLAPSCIVAGAGPGLEDSYGAIRRLLKNGALLIAVSSALGALLNAGICPGLIVACDGGNWARLHLFDYLRYFCNKTTPPALAFSLSAALPSQCAGLTLLPLGDGSIFQGLAQKCLGLPPVSFPQRGTVGASALDLAFSLSDGPVYAAGINFSHKDIRTHAKPYTFDGVLFSSAFRLRPLYGLQFERERMIDSSRVNKIYSDWFARQKFPRKIHSVSDGSPIVDGGGGNADIFIREKKRRVPHPVTRLVAELKAAFANQRTRDALTKELTELLPFGEVQAELSCIAKKYCDIEARNG